MNNRIQAVLLSLSFAFLCGYSICGCSTDAETTSSIPINETNSKLILKNCRVIDCTGAEPMEGMTIFIRDGLIEKIVKAKESELPADYEQIDVSGCTVMPGIINTHVHSMFTESILRNWLAHGITTVRELATVESEDSAGIRDELNKNPYNCRIVIATPILTKPDGYIPPFGVPVDSPEEAAEKTKQLLKNDPDVVKIAIEDNMQQKKWNMLTTEEVKSIVSTAHETNMWVATHITHVRNLPIAIEGGVDELSHMVVEPLSDELVNQIAAKGVYWVPTLELWQEVSATYNLDWDKTAVQNLSMFYKAGGKIALGTDFGGYFTTFDSGMPITEMKLMKEAGMTNMDILLSATKNAGVLCRMEDRIGTLEPGKIADIIVMNGDPLEDLSVLENLNMVIHNGVITKK